MGALLSALWLGAVYLWFERDFGLENLAYLLPGEIGQFLAGVVAPLALIWVLAGFLRTGARLRWLAGELQDLRLSLERASARLAAAGPPPAPLAANGAEPSLIPSAAPPAVGSQDSPLDRARAEAAGERQGGTVALLSKEATRAADRLPPEPEAPRTGNALDPAFRDLVQKTARDLNAICMDLSAVLSHPAARDEALRAYQRGQKEAFHLLLREHLLRHEPSEVMARLAQAGAQSLLHTYAVKFAGLLDEAQRRDASGGQEEALRRTAMGQLFAEVQRHTRQARG